MNDDFYSEIFEANALSPQIWYLFGIRLKDAADSLFAQYVEHLQRMRQGDADADGPELSFALTSSLLAGLAFENVLKAILISQGREMIKEGSLRKWPAGGHNQIELAREARLDLDDWDIEILDRLSAFVIWAGRYPVAMSPGKMRLINSSEELPHMPRPIREEEKPRIDGFFDRLVRIYRKG